MFPSILQGQLKIQRQQIEKALSDTKNKTDGIIISSISNDGLNDIVEKVRKKGVPVVDLINGLSSPHISARSAVSFWDNGFQAGDYLNNLQKKKGKTLNVLWCPGPKGAGWVAAGNSGFNAAISKKNIKIVETLYGDTGKNAQGALVQKALGLYKNSIDFIVGTTPTAEASIRILRRSGLSKRIKILSYYYSPGVHRGIQRGYIMAAPTDHQVLQARISIDILVRILEKKQFFKHVAPKVLVVDKKNIRIWDESTTLSPRGFRPIFSVKE